jgi:hypothetical protein
MERNTGGYRKDHPSRDIHGEFDANHEGPIIEMVGMGTQHGRVIFRYDGALYSRAARHEVQGKAVGDYTAYYQRHPNAWRCSKPGGYMCLKPFEGPWLEFKK